MRKGTFIILALTCAAVAILAGAQVSNPPTGAQSFSQLTISSGGSEIFMSQTAGLPGIWMGGNAASAGGSNYSILWDGSNTVINSLSGVAALRVNNANVLQAAGTVITESVPTVSAGTQTISGCSLSSAVGGSAAGSFHSGTAGTCTVTVTPGNTAPHGFSCWANDLTTTTDVLRQTATTTTTATIAGTTASGDIVNYGCIGY